MKTKSFIMLLVVATSFLQLSAQNIKQNIADGVTRFSNIFYNGIEEGVACYRIPAIVTANNGDIIAAIDQRVPGCGDLKWSKDINIIVRRSTNNGKTWSNIEMVVDFPYGQSASDPSFIIDESTGEIFLFYNYMDLDKERDIYYLHYVKSSDNGKTWSKPVDITSQIAKPEWKNDFKFITSGRGVFTSTGKLLHTIVNLNSGLHVFGSDDHGKSWYLIDTPITPGDESKIIELADGTWMINSRVNGSGFRTVHLSNDEGKTWTSETDKSLIDPSCNACILRYSKEDGSENSKNILLFSNAKHSKNRENLVVRYSYDEGKTWSDGKVVYPGGSAYSDMTILDNGDIAVFFEKDDYKANEVVVFSLEWLLEDND